MNERHFELITTNNMLTLLIITHATSTAWQ